MLGLPDAVTACLFDLDGVLTQHRRGARRGVEADVRRVPARARRAAGEPFVPFDPAADYDELRRRQAARRTAPASFLASRGIDAARRATPDDPPARRRQRARQPQERPRAATDPRATESSVYEGSVRYLRAARDAGLRTRGRVLQRQHRAGARGRPGSTDLFEARVDGVDGQRARPRRASRRPTRSSPGPRRSASTPAQAAVFEDALAGVEAGRAGGFALVVGVDRVGPGGRAARARRRRRRHDLAELLTEPP